MPYKAFILAAGEGRRMLPLTEKCPKPLLKIGEQCLIEYHINRLVAAGIRDIIINTSYLGHMVEEHLGDGSRYGACIHYSREDSPLETGGGLYKALPLIGDDPFILVNGDVWTDLSFYDIATREDIQQKISGGASVLFLVNNPAHHPQGDFDLAQPNGLAPVISNRRWTFSGVSVLNPAIIRDYPHLREKFPLKELFNFAIGQQKLFAELYYGEWMDIGTPERLALLRNKLPS